MVTSTFQIRIMQIGIPRETALGETRVAVTPETVKKMVAAKHTVLVERTAGHAARYGDDAYADAGAQLVDAQQALGAQLVLKVQAPDANELAAMKTCTTLIGMLEPFHADGLSSIAAAGITAFALESA